MRGYHTYHALESDGFINLLQQFANKEIIKSNTLLQHLSSSKNNFSSSIYSWCFFGTFEPLVIKLARTTGKMTLPKLAQDARQHNANITRYLPLSVQKQRASLPKSASRLYKASRKIQWKIVGVKVPIIAYMPMVSVCLGKSALWPSVECNVKLFFASVRVLKLSVQTVRLSGLNRVTYLHLNLPIYHLNARSIIAFKSNCKPEEQSLVAACYNFDVIWVRESWLV